MPDLALREDSARLAGVADEVAAFFAARAPAVDAGELDVRDGLRWLAERGLLGLALDWRSGDGPGLEPMGDLLSLIAEQCLASAFALWCHRLVVEYVAGALEAAFPRELTLRRLLEADLLGSTALGTAMAHLVTGAPLTVYFQRRGAELVLDGRIAWASNLLTEPAGAITVTAAVGPDGERIVLAVPLDTPGVRVAAYPRLLALQATRSSSVSLEAVRVPDAMVLAHLDACLPRIRPALLSLQSSFCRGLARAALAGARAGLSGTNVVFEPALERAEAELADLDGRLRAHLRQPDARQIPMRAFVQTRLDAARLVAAATRLELTVRGGRAYRLDDPANRRFREAAFLPMQAPTEGQLEWELRHSA